MNRLGVWPSSSRTRYLPSSSSSTNTSGVTGGTSDVVEIGARLGVQLPQLAEHLLDQLDRVARLARDHRQAVVLQVFQVVGDQRLELLVVAACRASIAAAGTRAGRGRRRRADRASAPAPAPAGPAPDRPSPASGPSRSSSRALQIAVGVEVVDDAVGHRPQLGLQIEPAQLVVQIVLQRLRPGDHVGHRVELALAGLFDLAARRTASAPRSGRATPRPSSSAARNRPRSCGSRRSPARALPRWGRRAACAPPARLLGGSSGSSSSNSRTGFSSISCSIRSCKARIGNCRISIDWIIRGASTCFCTIRRSWPSESRMAMSS